jgi:hypothetical protein
MTQARDPNTKNLSWGTARVPNRRSYIGGSDARIIMGQDEKALVRLWQEKCGEIGPEDLSTNLIVEEGGLGERERPNGTDGCAAALHAFLRLRNRTPAPPPFSSMNSTPAASKAFCALARTSSDTGGPKPASKRLIVITESLALSARSV